jgi:HlyD family secretion protein
MKRKIAFILVLVTITGLSAAAMYVRRDSEVPQVTTDVVSRGAIVNAISATGTLEAVETVQVGTQVSGSVKTLYADFNSIVKKGQLLAKLDPSIIQAESERAQANLATAEADVERVRVTVNDAKRKLVRARELFERQLIPAAELDAAEMAVRTSEAQVKGATAQVTQARAALEQTQVNLRKTVITSPIDGIVISRAVDVGQTVAASLQAPTLFTIAADLAQMQLKASIDESDLGSLKDGQAVTFSVDAYPNDVFRGVVKQVRLNPVIEQNVVTYAAIISAPNPALKLKPGMTANLTVEVARRDNVLRVPSSALRFKPTVAVLEALGGPRADAGTASGAARPTGTAGRPATSGEGTVWVYDGEHLQASRLKLGVSDSTYTEIVDGDVQEGTRLATQAAIAGATPARTGGQTSNPLMGPTMRRP